MACDHSKTDVENSTFGNAQKSSTHSQGALMNIMI
jgi:hypothetical protein